MIEFNYIMIAVFAVAMILYCFLFHSKSLHFILSVAWFALSIITIGCKIYYDINVLNISSTEIYNFAYYFSIFISVLRGLNFLLFCGVILSYYFNKTRSKNEL